MDISSLIPQLFYDVIGRIIPGAALLTVTFILFQGPEKGIHYLATWSDATTFIVLGNLLASHILASLLGGIWFHLSHIDFSWLSEWIGKYIDKVKYWNTWGKKGEARIEERLAQTSGNSNLLTCMSGMARPGDKIAFMYDAVLLSCPKAGARVAKLRAEQHMSGVLMVGFLVLAIAYGCFPEKRQSGLPCWLTEVLLLSAVVCAGSLAWHLEKRCGSALYTLWYLVASGSEEK